MKFPREKVIEAINCCAEFRCKECPYEVYEDPTNRLILRCIHALMEDIKELIASDEKHEQAKSRNTQEEWEKFWRNL